MPLKNERGFVLIIMLLFLLVLNLLALSILNVGLLETKMEVAYLDKVRSFYHAESNLLRAEQEILAGKSVTTLNVDVAVINSGICGVIFYRLTAHGGYNGAKSSLQSTVARLVDASRCSVKPNVTAGRQSFLVVF